MTDQIHLLPPFRPVDPTLPAGPQIFEALRHAILRMELAPGLALSEADLAHALGASRTPLRAALQDLRALGLVETRPSRGTFVTPLDAGRVRAAQFVREALEVATVARLATEGVPNGAEIEANLSGQQAAVADGDAVEFGRLDDTFHLKLARATGFDQLADVLEREKAQLDRLRRLSLRDGGRLGELLAEHRSIFAAVQAGDVEAARVAMRGHLRSVLGVLDDLARDHAAYFTGDST